MSNKLVYDRDRQIIFHGVESGHLWIFCDREGYAFAKMVTGKFCPIFYDGEHVSFENAKFDYGQCLDRGVFSIGPVNKNVTESVVRWSDLGECLPPEEEVARLKEKVVELSEKVSELSDMILGFMEENQC